MIFHLWDWWNNCMFKKLFLISIIFLSSCVMELPQSKNISTNPDFLVFEAKNGFEIFYDSGATKSLEDLYTPGSIILNGSYFWLTDSGAYMPAWLWIVDGKKFSEKRKDDPNLSMVISLCDTQWSITYNYSWDRLFCASWWKSVFQAWPLVLNEGWIASSFLGSWHADEPHERTMMGLTHDNQIYFFIFTKKVTLRMAWEAIMKLPQFAHSHIDVINLDGWPSTAYLDGNIGFNENKKLPILIRTHP